jgi:integral membrane sensor domain MASE1
VLISAIGLRYCFDGLPRLNSVKALVKYSFFAVVLAPFAGAFISAHGIARDYWTGWKIVFLSEVLAFVTVTPALLSWVSEARGLMRSSRAHRIEGVILIAGLVVVSYIVFTVPEDSRSPTLFYALVPFLLWSVFQSSTSHRPVTPTDVPGCRFDTLHGSGSPR